MDWLRGVILGYYWCMKTTDVTCANVCADPPSRGELAVILVTMMRRW